MTKVRISTTVDAELFDAAQRGRDLRQGELIAEALHALVRRDRASAIDASYAAYHEHPLDEADEWGDLASWQDAADRARAR